MRRVAVIQARMTSSRLPGKVLERIGEIPMIVFMLRRVARAAQLDHVVVATSVDHSDDALSLEVSRYGFDCQRGELLDVLDRFEAVAKQTSADVIVRLTGDCPLIDPDLIDRLVSMLIAGGLDYVSNVDPPSYPDGQDVEVFSRHALSVAHGSATLPLDREHVTPFIRRNKELFQQTNVRSVVDLSALRWTVDHADDLAFIRALVGSLPADSAFADRFDFLRILESQRARFPENRHVRNEGYSETSTTVVSKS
jgi:spore coat polysaccharide biosynthesis protein SpsF (cytidylyltransferase family)